MKNESNDEPAPCIPDEHHQFLCTNKTDEIYLKYGYWTLDLACQLITIGHPVNLDRLSSAKENWLEDGSDFTDKFLAMATVVSRAHELARSSLHPKAMQDPDSPENWIQWAKSKGYSVLHLIPATPAEKSKSPTGNSIGSSNWTVQARQIADECFEQDTKNGCRDSLRGYSSRVMELMQIRGIKGPRGIIDNANYVKREALQSNNWWANKAK
jgi:hypothetical protein